MTLELLRDFFMWCTIINIGLMMVAALILLCATDWVYKMHSRWFPMSREAFNIVWYSTMAGYKILVFVFNVVPFVALCIVS